ncbi:MAG: tcyB [Gemmataceae bacterium]|nr:tcyB [Gemmataceae bacterium]
MEHRLSLWVVAALAVTSGPAAAQEKKPLRWGTDPTGGAPYVYQDAAGTFIGFEVELADYLGQKLGRTPVMKAGDWDKLPQLLDRPADSPDAIDVVLNGYELKESLQSDYTATTPYYAYRLVLLTHKDADSLKDWKDLTPAAGPKRSVGVLNASAAYQYAKDRFADRVELAINPDVVTVIGLVRDRRLDATVQDNPAATYFLKETPALKAVGEPRQPGFYVIYTRKADTDLAAGLSDAIKDGLRDGTLRRIYQKYGLWNGDQEWLCYHQTGRWPADEDAGEEAASGEKVNPWPRMIRELLGAAGMTVFLSATSFPLAMLLGLLVALGRVYGPRWLAVPLGVYVEVLRGTPLLLQLYFVFYLLPGVIPVLTLSPLQAGIIGLAINYSAYEAENYRAGLLAIPRGQMEAALALGMTPLTAIRTVIVPQALRIVIPPVTNDFIALFKDTSVCSVILITELTRKYNELYNFNREYIAELAFVTAGLYLVMSYPMALLARWLEVRTSTKGERGA